MGKLDQFKAKKQPFAANHLLFSWLSDDQQRADLYAELRKAGGVLPFQSRADITERTWHDTDSQLRQDVYLLAERADIEKALKGDGKDYDNAPYQMLGSGTFMLGLDKKKALPQREFAEAYFKLITPGEYQALRQVAVLTAAVHPLKQRNFDLVELAEQIAVRFVGFLFGFEQPDHVLIEQAMRKTYRGLNYVILGRHFVSEPGTIDDASRAMGALLIRVAELIDLYGAPIGREQRELMERIQLEQDDLRKFKEKNPGDGPLAAFKPILQRIAEQQGKDPATAEFSTSELAVTVVGLIAGMIGNIQASVCIAINELFDPKHKQKLSNEATELARKSALNDRDYQDPVKKIEAWIWEALRLNPPAAFLPRRTTTEVESKSGVRIPAGKVVILAMGSATRQAGGDDFRYEPPADKAPDPLIFGDGGAHDCVGKFIAMPLVARIVRDVLALPGLAETLDPETGDWQRLEKHWGFYCTRYPFEYNRFDLLTQSPLIVIMQVKKPITEHAEVLKKVIQYGAPRIEAKLRASGHVHFASFIFLENDSKLALYTVYDRDFDAYIEYFALDVGPLFDRIFEHIEDAPPLPVNKFPKEFVETIRRYNHQPAAGYLFSAYPRASVSMITQNYPAEDA